MTSSCIHVVWIRGGVARNSLGICDHAIGVRIKRDATFTCLNQVVRDSHLPGLSKASPPPELSGGSIGTSLRTKFTTTIGRY
jgi:hypothetical protein